MNGQKISFDVNGQPAKGYLATPSQSEAPGVIVLHAWWGLNQFFEDLCDRLASEGFAAFAPDLNEGRIAETVAEAEQIMSELSAERKQAIVAALVDFMRSRPEVRKGPLSLVGFSMGGAWSLALAGEQPEDIGHVVLFYGAGGEDFGKIKADILGHFSDSDDWEPLDGIRAMEADMRAAGLNPTFHIYPQMPHWFFEENRPEFDPQAAEIAWKRSLEFLKK
ncbi:MAG: dienelactone hydrolase family protein [Bacteroidota bacterium]